MKKTFWLGIIFSMFFLYITFRKVNLEEMKYALKTVNYLWLLPAACIYLSVFLLRTIRWKYIFSPLKENAGFFSLFSALGIGFMANNILPVRIGELVRAYLIGKKEHVSKTASIATIILERLFDALTILFLLSIISLFFPFPFWIKKISKSAVIFFPVLIIFLYTLLHWKTRTLLVIKKIIFFFPCALKEKIITILDSFVSGCQVLRKKKNLALILFFSLAVWLAEAVTFYLVTKAFHLPIGFFGAVFVMIFICLGLVVPSSPGFIGVYEYFCITALQILAIPKAQAIPYAVVMHGLQFSLILLLGIFLLWKENISWSQIKQGQKLNNNT